MDAVTTSGSYTKLKLRKSGSLLFTICAADAAWGAACRNASQVSVVVTSPTDTARAYTLTCGGTCSATLNNTDTDTSDYTAAFTLQNSGAANAYARVSVRSRAPVDPPPSPKTSSGGSSDNTKVYVGVGVAVVAAGGLYWYTRPPTKRAGHKKNDELEKDEGEVGALRIWEL